jgi:hypothetical protein
MRFSSMPGKPKGTIKGHPITRAQQKLFGMARGMQEGSTLKTKTAAGKIAKSIAPSDLHKIAQKPKSGYRKSK